MSMGQQVLLAESALFSGFRKVLQNGATSQHHQHHQHPPVNEG
jgi:hypothetical protein